MRKSDNLFESVKNILNNYMLKKNCDAIIIDIHGEAASEKQALANYLDGKVTAVIGTHTHVPTSDLRIFLMAQHIKQMPECVVIMIR